ncbi:MAG: helix-turn-helix transcriptional regulator [Roseibium sp.]|nr:helix-turn-helix transcriptional regulator [Roseibium sp.]
MGRHSFTKEPEHCQVYRSMKGEGALPAIYGIGEHWNMPAIRHRANLGAGTRFAGVGHYIFTYHIGGANARRLDLNGGMDIASTGALSLQRPHSGGTFASSGVVEYCHFYFKQGLLCEIADELEGPEEAEPDDFFALFDSTAGKDASAYIERAGSPDDPPTAMEMDSRGYLLGLGIMRAIRKRKGYLLTLAEIKPGCPMRRAIEHMEDRIADPVRLTDLAATVDMSPFHFSRVFKSEMGETPARYLMKRRLSRASELIRQTDLSLAEVAFRTGFSSQGHMTSRMKAVLGVTPGELRRNT